MRRVRLGRRHRSVTTAGARTYLCWDLFLLRAILWSCCCAVNHVPPSQKISLGTRPFGLLSSTTDPSCRGSLSPPARPSSSAPARSPSPRSTASRTSGATTPPPPSRTSRSPAWTTSRSPSSCGTRTRISTRTYSAPSLRSRLTMTSASRRVRPRRTSWSDGTSV
ncbi:hypothetical protein C8R47DRAFT_457756 [Mycena vitilis]|nr:hypothetical protein C8R47DRAFT_457756 [Mycena vitilis]